MKKKKSGPLETDKDRGYSWVILAACFFIYLLTMGTIKTFGILYAELLYTYQGGSGNTASIGSTCSFIQSFLGPMANALSLRFSFRRISFIGGIFLSIGFLTSAFTDSMQILYITYSLIVGIGYGLTFVPCTTLLNFYFEKNRALANGIVVSGSGLGNFIFPFLYRFLLDNYGLHGTMIILSGLMLNCCVAAALYRQPVELFRTKSSRKLLDKEDSPAADTQSSTKCQNCTKFFISIFKFRWSLFHSMSFLAVTVSFAIAIVGYGANFYILPVFIESLHFTKDDVSVTLCIIGVLEVISRILFGWFVDRKLVSAKVIFVFSMFISGISTLSLPHVKDVYVLYVYAGIVGTFPGSLYTLMPVIIIDTVGLGSLPSALGLMTLFNSLVAVVGIPCLGWLQDLTGSWDASFYYMTSLFLASSITVLLVHIFKKKDKTTNKDFETPDEIIDTHFNSDDNSNEAVKVV